MWKMSNLGWLERNLQVVSKPSPHSWLKENLRFILQYQFIYSRSETFKEPVMRVIFMARRAQTQVTACTTQIGQEFNG
jgi:hypothetical protein